MAIKIRVDGQIPPKKDGASSMWRKPSSIPLLRALRSAACQEMAGRPPYDEPVKLSLRICLPENDKTSLYARRKYGDLDNFITGICDALQASAGFDPIAWEDLAESARPDCAIAFTDDSWVTSIEASLLDDDGSAPWYEVVVAPIE